jgi:hypothetical protein
LVLMKRQHKWSEKRASRRIKNHPSRKKGACSQRNRWGRMTSRPLR